MTVGVEGAPVALISGAASGIGRAAATSLANRGYRLALVDISEGGLRSVSAEIGGGECAIFVCDVTDEAGVTSACEAAISRFGAVDCLVACAGIGRYSGFLDLEPELWRRMFEVNVMGPVCFIRALLPHMVRRGEGAIILIGSRRGLEPSRGTAAYSASKAALHAVARSLADEYAGTGLAVTYVAPGGTRTNLDTPKDERFMEPETVGEAIAFVCDQRGRGWVRDLMILPAGL